jgi:4-carboxymuconolactone decarboxylase
MAETGNHEVEHPTGWPEPRLFAPAPAVYNPRQQEIHDTIASGPRGSVRGPLAIWLHRPVLAAEAQALGYYRSHDTAPALWLSKLAILTMARHWSIEYEWAAHRREALKAGLSPALMVAIRLGDAPPCTDAEEEIVHALARAVLETRGGADGLYARAVAASGHG